MQSGEHEDAEHMGAYNLGELNSTISFSFENAQCFEKIGKYYIIVKKLVSILTLQNNIFLKHILVRKTLMVNILEQGYVKYLIAMRIIL